MKLARGIGAVALWLGFYVLGIGLVVLLLSVPWVQVVYGEQLGFAGIACGIGALWIGFGLLPRFEREDPRQRPLDAARHPQLFAWIAEISRSVGEAAPSEVYLLPEANAFAGARTRWLGLRRTNIVGLGLPLFAMLDRAELGSVLAHELGHHRGGDTRVGPWIHGTRRAIARALDHLEGSAFWLHLPFFAYGRMFMRLTASAAREQELAADALAAKVVGASAAASALQRVEVSGPQWEAYFSSEVVPLLDRGFRPPLLEGFRRFLAVPVLRVDLQRAIERGRERAPSPFDSHPPLAERLAALGVTRPAREPEAASLLTLLGDPSAAEDHALRSILRDPDRPLEDVSWDDVATRAWLPMWTADFASVGAALEGMTPADLPMILEDPQAWGQRLRRGVSLLSREAERRRLIGVLGTWLLLELHRRGFTITLEPGGESVATRDELSLEPELAVHQLASGELSAKEWRQRCVALGLVDDAPSIEPRAAHGDASHALRR